ALGTSYPAIVQAVAALLRRPELRPDPASGLPPRLAIDATGVGRPVIDLFLAAAMPATLYPVTITGGDAPRWDGRSAWVPKKDLVGAVQATLQSGRLKVVPMLVLAETL